MGLTFEIIQQLKAAFQLCGEGEFLGGISDLRMREAIKYRAGCQAAYRMVPILASENPDAIVQI